MNKVMKFLAREEEMSRLDKAINVNGFSFIVLWGRRRVGKSRLLIEWIKKKNHGIYFVADESKDTIQRKYFAQALEEVVPGISDGEYADWKGLLRRLTLGIKESGWKGPLIIDELPYLVESAPELTSIMQNWIDLDLKPIGFNLVVSGSSQSMMQGLVLSEQSPLYGRATEVMKIKPLAPRYLKDALGIKSAREIIKAYTLWGGIPRYWELAESYGSDIDEAAHELLLRPEGILSQEPNRLLQEERPTAISLRPALDAIGMGSHKSSEIAGRLGMSATSLSKILARLQELDLIEKELPYGDLERAGKRSLYKIKDPLFRVWFQLISGRRGQFASLSKQERLQLLEEKMPFLISNTWEKLCLKAFKKLSGLPEGVWNEPARYWRGNGPEWDLITTTLDNESIVIGECKWRAGRIDLQWIRETIYKLFQKGTPKGLNFKENNIYYYLFIPEAPKDSFYFDEHIRVIDADEVISCLDVSI